MRLHLSRLWVLLGQLRAAESHLTNTLKPRTMTHPLMCRCGGRRMRQSAWRESGCQTEKCKGDVVWVTINLWCAGAAEGGCGKGPGARVDDQLAGQAHGVRQRFAP